MTARPASLAAPAFEGLAPPGSGSKTEAAEDTRATDLGLAKRFVEQHGARIRYCAAMGWLSDEGTHWQIDETGQVYRLLAETAETVWAELPRVTNRAQWFKFAQRSESATGQAAALKLAGTREPVAVRAADFDRDGWIINTRSGVVDLRTGRLRQRRADDLLTKLAPVDYDPGARAPQWESFLRVIFPDRPELIAYVQRALGYSVTGDVSEHALFFAHGSGRNGKSTLLNTVQTVLGTYARTADPELLLVHRGEVHPTRLAELYGARFVTSIETEEGGRFAEVLVKWLTGGDKITARRMRRDFFQFDPTHHLWLAANHRPGVRGTDIGIWSRIHLIPFTVHLPTALGDAYDLHFAEKLTAEYPGILAWLIRGCLAWQRDGLSPPAEVVAATAQYRAEMDAMGRFVAEQCVVDPYATAPAAALYGAYKTWAAAAGEYQQPQTKFNEYLELRGYVKHRSSSGFYWKGVGLNVDAV